MFDVTHVRCKFDGEFFQPLGRTVCNTTLVGGSNRGVRGSVQNTMKFIRTVKFMAIWNRDRGFVFRAWLYFDDTLVYGTSSSPGFIQTRISACYILENFM